MNERIAKLYDQALVLESNGDYVAGELDPVKFAELIVRECANLTRWEEYGMSKEQRIRLEIYQEIKQHFGVN